jgi:hypothetical protein
MDQIKFIIQQRNCWNKDNTITSNLINVESNVKRWKFQTLDQILNTKKKLMARINGVHRCIQNRQNSGGLRRLENKLQIELSETLKKEELMWYQRSRAKRLKDGDRNTRYYHLKTVNRRKNNAFFLKGQNFIETGTRSTKGYK